MGKNIGKLPAISGKEIIRCFEKLGYEVIRQKGSHIRMRHKNDNSKKPLTIPNHQTVGRGLLRKILRDADISAEDFNELP